MNFNNKTNNIIFYNYLEDFWKEKRHVAWRLLKTSNLFFSPLRKTSLLVDKNSSLIYKEKFVVSILSKYLYSIKKHLKLYSLFLLFFNKLRKTSFYRKNEFFHRKKKTKFFYHKRTMVYKKHYFVWYKKWFKKKYKKYRRQLWKSFHRVPTLFWGNLLKKRTKSFIFNALKVSKFKKKIISKDYNSLFRMIFFFIRRKKGQKISRKKLNKKYRINILSPAPFKKIEYLQKKYYYQNIFPVLNNVNHGIIKNNNINFNINNHFIKSELFNNPSTYLFFVNYNYYHFLLNLRKKNIFIQNKNILFSYYKMLSSIYSKKKKYKLIRTCILNNKNEYSKLQHGIYINIFVYWKESFIKNSITKYKFIYKKLLRYSNNNLVFYKSKVVFRNLLFNNLKDNITFSIISKKSDVKKKTFIKNIFYSNLLKYKKPKKTKITISNNWYKYIIKRRYRNKKKNRNNRKKITNKFRVNKKLFFYPYRKKRGRFNLFSRNIKWFNKKNILHRKYFLYLKRKKKKFYVKRRTLFKKYKKKNKIYKNKFIHIKNKCFFLEKLRFSKKKRKHFLKKYKRKLKWRLKYYRKKKIKKNFRKINDNIYFSNKENINYVKKNFLKLNKFNNAIIKVNKKFKKKYIFFLRKKLNYLSDVKDKYYTLNNYLINKKIYINKRHLFNFSSIYKEFFVYFLFKLKNKRFNKFRRLLKYIKFRMNNDIKYNNNSNKNRLYKITLDNFNKFNLSTNIIIYMSSFKHVYSNLLIPYYRWISVEFSKNLFFNWLNTIKNINSLNKINISYKYYSIKY